MGCQQICQNDEDKNIILADTGSKTSSSFNAINVRQSRNQKQNTENLLSTNSKVLTQRSFKCSNNVKEKLKHKDTLRFTIAASNVHKMIPYWIKKDCHIFFRVAGLWGFAEHCELFDCNGCPSFDEKPNNLYFGSLVGYVQGLPFFPIYDGLDITFDQEGPLYVFQNNGLYSVNPKGELEVEIKGGIPLTIEEIQKNMGWDLAILDTSIPEMKEDEVDLLILLNKVRTNPKLFVSQYLKGEENENDLSEVLLNMDILNPLSTNKKIYEVSKKHAIDLGLNELAGHISSNGMTMEDRLNSNSIFTKVFAENCIFGYNDPMEIMLRLLIDEDNENRNQRKIILSKEFNTIGISIEPHSGEFCWSCIQDFILDA